jgi:four helix bundle protein
MTREEDFGFKELIIWRKSIDFAKHVIVVIDNINSDRKHYRILEQTEAAATSVAANIAEGKGRSSRKEFKQFLYITRGSIYETVTFLNIMKELNWLSAEEINELEKEALILNKMLNSLVNKLKTD